MLHVTIRDIKTNNIIYYGEVSTLALQAVGRTNTIRLRRMTDDAEPRDVILCAHALIKEAEEAKNLISEAFTEAADKAISDEVDDDPE